MILPSSFPTWLNAHPNRWLNTIASAFAFPFDRAMPVKTILVAMGYLLLSCLAPLPGRKRSAMVISPDPAIQCRKPATELTVRSVAEPRRVSHGSTMLLSSRDDLGLLI